MSIALACRTLLLMLQGRHYSLANQETHEVQLDMPAIDNDTAFAELVRNYEDLWVAIDDRSGVKLIVGSGKDAVEAAESAEAKGFPDAVLLRVPSFDSTFIPSATLTSSH